MSLSTLISFLQTDANAANALAALASVIVAAIAVLVSIMSLTISIWAVLSQRKHNYCSVQPLAEITVADFENSLRVKLRNNGTGPMIITDVTVINETEQRPSIVEWMPDLPRSRPWNTFSNALQDRTLQPGGVIVLLELTEYDGEKDFSTYRDKVRKALAPLTVTVIYTDIYQNKLPPRSKKLDWFGRRL